MALTEWIEERKIDRGSFEVLVDRNTRTQEVRVAVYKGKVLLAMEVVQPLEATIERMVGLAAERAPAFLVSRS